MNMDQLKEAVGDVKPEGKPEGCELIEAAELEACECGGGIPWVRWGMAF